MGVVVVAMGMEVEAVLVVVASEEVELDWAEGATDLEEEVPEVVRALADVAEEDVVVVLEEVVLEEVVVVLIWVAFATCDKIFQNSTLFEGTRFLIFIIYYFVARHLL